MTSAYPLSWPPGRPRTSFRTRSKFDTSFGRARDGLNDELERLGAKMPVLSTNLELNLSGQPRGGLPEPTDPGVAVYFQLKGKPMCFACDRWNRVGDNIHAIAKTIEALRGISRWGSGDMLAQAFSGFAAIEAPKSWRERLGLPPTATLADAEAAWKRLAFEAHPDRGGSHQRMADINTAIADARRELAR
ncbi:MAG: J domain-containing protein [Alphaproteobacteria bacterium]